MEFLRSARPRFVSVAGALHPEAAVPVLAIVDNREYGRDIQIWSFGYIVQRETEKEAKEFLHYYVHKKGDWVVGGNLMRLLGIGSLAVEDFRRLQAHFMAGWGAFPLVGNKEQIIEGLANLSKVGIDGALRSWPIYEKGMLDFQKKTLPLLKQAGLR